jgi:hypothetical protein
MREIRLPKTYWALAFGLWFLSLLFLPSSKWSNNFVYVFLLLPALVSITREDTKNFIKEPVFQLFLLVIFVVLIRATWDQFFVQWKYTLVILLFYMAVSRLPSLTTYQWWKVSVVGLFLITLYVATDLYWKKSTGAWNWGSRLVEHFGNTENPILVSIFIGSLLAIATITSIQLKRVAWIIFLHAVALTLALYFLQSRTFIPIWLTVFTLGFLYAAYVNWYSKRLLAGLYFLSLAGFVFWITQSALGQTLLTRADSYRFEIWKGYVQEVIAHCSTWLGCGFDSTFRYVATGNYPMQHAHSIYVSQFFYTGAIGLIALLALFVVAIRSGFKHHAPMAACLLSGCVGFLFDGNAFITSPKPLWLSIHFPIAAIIAASISNKTNKV